MNIANSKRLTHSGAKTMMTAAITAAQQGGLAGAGAADDRQKLAGGDRERHVTERRLPVAIVFADPGEGDCGVHPATMRGERAHCNGL